MKKFLFVGLILFSSSLFSYDVNPNIPPDTFDPDHDLASETSRSYGVCDMGYPSGTSVLNALNADGNTLYLYTNKTYTNSCTGAYEFPHYKFTIIHFNINKNATCPAGQIVSGGECVTPPAPTCGESQYLDDNNTCQDLGIPTNFPKEGTKDSGGDGGIAGIHSRDSDGSDCNPGEEFNSDIAYAQTLGYNPDTGKCFDASYFCNSGLTWDINNKTCIIPPDTKNFNPDKNEISPDLANTCTSGQWAKAGYVDFCSNDLCYIGADLASYNLSCGNKYLKYQCTSDYRIIKFMQVSCGEPNKADYDKSNSTLPPSQDNPDVVPDTSTDSTNSNMATAISNQTNDLKRSLDAVNNSVKKTNDALNTLHSDLTDTNTKLDKVSASVDANTKTLHDGLYSDTNPFDGVEFTDGSDKFGEFEATAKDSFGVLKFTNIFGLANANGLTLHTYGFTLYGYHAVIFSPDMMNNFPIAEMRSLIVFLFAVLGFVQTFRGV